MRRYLRSYAEDRELSASRARSWMYRCDPARAEFIDHVTLPRTANSRADLFVDCSGFRDC